LGLTNEQLDATDRWIEEWVFGSSDTIHMNERFERLYSFFRNDFLPETASDKSVDRVVTRNRKEEIKRTIPT